MVVMVVMIMIMVVMIVLVVVVVLLLLVVVMRMVVVVMIMVVMLVLVLVMMLVVVITMVVVMVVVMMPLTVGDGAIDGDVVGDDDDSGWGALNWGTCKCLLVWVHVLLFLPNSFSPLNLPKHIFFNTGPAPVWILCQIICNRLVVRIALQPQYSVNFDPCLLYIYKHIYFASFGLPK